MNNIIIFVWNSMIYAQQQNKLNNDYKNRRLRPMYGARIVGSLWYHCPSDTT